MGLLCGLKSKTFVAILKYLCLLLMFVLVMESAAACTEFQYPCFTDICLFPTHFCSSTMRMCQECKFECNVKGSFPLACTDFCTKGSDHEADQMQNLSWRASEAWFYTTITLVGLLIVAIVLLFLWKKGYIRCNRPKCKSSTESVGLVPEDELLTGSSAGSSASDASTKTVPEDPASFTNDDPETGLADKKLYNVPPTDYQRSDEDAKLVTSVSGPYATRTDGS